MKIAIITLVVVLVALGVYFTSRSQELTPKQSTAEIPLSTNQVAVVATTTATQAAIPSSKELVTTLQTDTNKVENQVHRFEDKLSSVERELTNSRSELAEQLGNVTNQIVILHQQIDKLKQTNVANDTELAALQNKYTALEMEKDSLVRELNDLPSLQYQIATVKRRLWQEHIAVWNRESDWMGQHGNHGYIMKDGNLLTVFIPKSAAQQ